MKISNESWAKVSIKFILNIGPIIGLLWIKDYDLITYALVSFNLFIDHFALVSIVL